jgi:hypothetical protein
VLEISFFLAGIRTQNWQALYNSIKVCTSREFELIFVGPQGLPDSLKDTPNVKFIEDWGCPSRCYQIGLLACTAPYVLYVADDGVFLDNGCIDNAFATLSSLPPSKKNVISLRYYEGSAKKKAGPTEDYWRMRFHKPHKYMPEIYIPPHFLLVMNGLFYREYILEIGGFDCQFEQPGYGAPDLGARAQHDGANVVLGDYFMELFDGRAGHSPIGVAAQKFDKPAFKHIWKRATCMDRIKIDVNNWKNYPEVWPRRFPQGKQ